MDFSHKELELMKALAENGPLTGYAIHTKMEIMSDAHWETTRKKLIKMEMIAIVKNGGRGKPYWFSPKGAVIALGYVGCSEEIRKYAPKYFKKNDQLEKILFHSELADSEAGRKLLKVQLQGAFSNPKSENPMEILQDFSILNIDLITQYFSIAEKYPSIASTAKNEMKMLYELIRDRLEKMVD